MLNNYYNGNTQRLKESTEKSSQGVLPEFIPQNKYEIVEIAKKYRWNIQRLPYEIGILKEWRK